MWIALVLGVALACGSGKSDDFGDEPEKKGAAGEQGSGGAGGTGGATAVCAPGATQACLGPGQCPGAQICTTEGDGWGECDCGSSSGGSGGSEMGGTGGKSTAGGTGGTPESGGTDNAGSGDTSGSGGSKGGTTGGGAGKGGSAGTGGNAIGESCNTDFCDAYCDASTGHCANDKSRDECMTQCTETRCETQTGCLEQGADYFTCIAESTPVCISDTSLPGDGDCRDVAATFFDCLVVPWHCDESDGACICSRTRNSTSPATCPMKHKCCVATVSGTACGCDDVEFCEDLGPGYIPTERCPLL